MLGETFLNTVESLKYRRVLECNPCYLPNLPLKIVSNKRISVSPQKVVYGWMWRSLLLKCWWFSESRGYLYQICVKILFSVMQASTLDLQINSLKYTIRSSNFYVTCIDPLGNNIHSRSREKHQFLMALGMMILGESWNTIFES